ncbi:MAG TPA: prolyl oligopeptidase family serine peptidase [Gemmatimonadaceae bacterium]
MAAERSRQRENGCWPSLSTEEQLRRRLCTVILVLVFVQACLVVPHQLAAQDAAPTTTLRPLPIPAALGMKHIGDFQPIAVSPDGTKVLFTMCNPQRQVRARAGQSLRPHDVQAGTGCDVLLSDVANGRVTDLTGGQGNNWGASWSPTGERVAYLSDRTGVVRLYVTSRAGETHVLGEAKSYQVPRWVDATKIVYLAPPEDSSRTRTVSDPYLTTSHVPGATPTVYRSRANLTAAELQQHSAATSDATAYPIEWRRAAMIVMDLESGRRTVLESGEVFASDNVGSFAMPSPDGKLIAYSISRGFAGPNTFQQSFDLVISTTGDPVSKRVVARRVPQWFGADVSWSPDGRYVAWFTDGPRDPGNVYVYDARTDRTRCLTPREHPDFSPGVSAQGVNPPVWLDAHTIVARTFTGPHDTAYELAVPHALWTIDVESGSAHEVTSIEGATIFSILTRAPSQLALRIGSEIVVALEDSATYHQTLYAVNLDDGSVQALPTGLDAAEPHNIGYWTYWDSPRGSADGRSIVYVRQSADESPDIWLLPIGSAPRRITRLNPVFDSIPLGKTRMLSYADTSGTMLRAALLLPPHWTAGHRVPLIVYPYGGEKRSHWINKFGLSLMAEAVDNMQIFATRGYAVLLPDAPVHVGTPMTDIARTVLAGVDAAIRLGYADPARIGVLGHSYGGYTVFSLIVQTHRFRAAVAASGFSDWVPMYAALSEDGSAQGIAQAEQREYGLGGSPWEVRYRYIANSPFYFFDRVTTPTLIVHGTRDALLDWNSAMSFVALRRLGKDAALALYSGEQHVIGDWRYANQLDYLERVVAWFDRYMCPDRGSAVICD